MSAPQVCLICKRRKKKCDKRLPRCSYCEQKHIDCSYDYGAALVSPTSTTTPGSIPESASQVSVPEHSSVFGEETHHGYRRPPLMLPVPSIPIASLLEPASLHTTSAIAMVRIIEASGQSIDEISSRYFNGIHLWVPFFCPGRFRKDVLCYHSRPTADFSLLILCMCLLTYRSAEKHGQCNNHAMLYLYAKTFLAQLNAILPASLQLIQAGLFISIYEYSISQPDRALMAIDACIRLAYKLGIHNKPECPGWSGGWNTWWGLRIFERIFYCDATTRAVPLMTSAPAEEDLLPHEVDEFDWEQRLAWSGKLTPIHVAGVGCLGRAAQAMYLLDRVVKATERSPVDLSSLIILDGELQRLLSITMDKCHGRRGGHCGSVGTSIRALFMLHQNILHSDHSAIDTQLRKHSEAALDTVAQMVIDIARSHRDIPDNDIDVISPICRYVAQYTLDHLYRKRYSDQNKWFRDVDALRESLAKLACRWPAEGGV